MKKIEIVLLAFFGLEVTLQLVEFPGLVVTAVSSTTLALLYFIFGFAIFNGITFGAISKKSSYKDIPVLKIFTAILVGWTLGSLVIGISGKLILFNNSKLEMLTEANRKRS